MSIQAATQFTEKWAGSEALQADLDKALAGKEGRAAIDVVVAIGKANGFEFTADEAMAIRGALIEQMRKEGVGGELTAEELGQVSGGVQFPKVATPQYWVGGMFTKKYWSNVPKW